MVFSTCSALTRIWKGTICYQLNKKHNKSENNYVLKANLVDKHKVENRACCRTVWIQYPSLDKISMVFLIAVVDTLDYLIVFCVYSVLTFICKGVTNVKPAQPYFVCQRMRKQKHNTHTNIFKQHAFVKPNAQKAMLFKICLGSTSSVSANLCCICCVVSMCAEYIL